MSRFTFTEPDGRVHAIERRWPRRGERAPWCGQTGCGHRARFVYHVGVTTSASLCEPHALARIAANERTYR